MPKDLAQAVSEEVDIDDPAEMLPPPDAHQQAIEALNLHLLRLGSRLSSSKRKAAQLHEAGKNYTEIAAELGRAPATISKWVNKPVVQRYLHAIRCRANYLAGPKLEARAAMLWRIATANEDKNPRVAIQAVDVLNKTVGTYADQQRDLADSGPPSVTVIQHFFLEEGVRPHQSPVEKPAAALEGEFTPLVVELPAPREEPQPK